MREPMVYPYAAIVGQANFKLALELALVDKSIGGVLVSGDKGTGKTTTVRSLSALLGEGDEFPFINLPVGASEDRVLGSVDLELLINEKRQVLKRGLLAQANGGILYIDEVNLLPDYLTDILLDAAATGSYYLEREGLSLRQESRFSLVGTMNPEEGALRPQLLDRFGLGVDVKTPQSVSERVRIAQRRVAFDDNPVAFIAAYHEQQRAVHARLVQARNRLNTIQVPDAVYTYAAEVCIKHAVEGLRSDVLLIKAGRAYASLRGADVVSPSDVDAVAPFVLRYRSKTPPSPAGQSPDTGSNSSDSGSSNGNSQSEEPPPPQHVPGEEKTAGLKFFHKRTAQATDKGKAIQTDRTVPGRPAGRPSEDRTDLLKTVTQYTASGNFKVVYKPASGHASLLVFFLVDASGSMLRDHQLQHCRGVIRQTLTEHAGKRICFAGVGLVNGGAEVFEPGTTDVGVFMQHVMDFRAGGRTNLRSGFERVSGLLKQHHLSRYDQKHLYILTDGRVNVGSATSTDPLQEAADYYHTYLKAFRYTQVLNTESSFVKLGQARVLADALRANYQALS